MNFLVAAINTFSSCNKAGSIPQFTQHLRSNPNSYTALTWRGRAYSIIGDKDNAKADFVRAANVTSSPQKDLAQAECEILFGNVQQGICILFSVVNEHPNCAEARSNLGRCLMESFPDVAFEHLKKAVEIGKSNGETSEPWYPWTNNHLGDMCYTDGRIDLSSEYYNEAIRTCSSLTVAHLGSSRCDILRNNTTQAKARFEVAKKLNPELVHWASFDDFRADVIAGSKGRAQAYGAVQISEASRRSGRRRGGGGRGKDGSGSDSSGEDSDNDEDRARDAQADAMNRIKKEAPAIKRYNGRKYYQSKDGKYWYVKDTAGHAGALLKKYKDRRSSLEFVGSMTIDKRGKLVDMANKHESCKIPIIEKNDMINCK